MGLMGKVSVIAGSSILPARMCSTFSHIGWPTSLHQQHQQSPLTSTTSGVVCVTTWGKSRLLATVSCADREYESRNFTTLLIGSQQDTASCAIMNALLARGNWIHVSAGQESTQGKHCSAGQAWEHMTSPVSLWSVQRSLLDMDDADHLWMEQEPSANPIETRRRWQRAPSDVIFLSKHVARSGTPALCVHPIGLADPSSSSEAGGRPGHCPPPSPRLASCLRELRRVTQAAGLDDVFDVTLEVTHHGPWLETPAMFVEIGSTEEHWGRTDAAEVWAETISRLLGLDGESKGETWTCLDPSIRADRAVFVGLGGGHYAPRFRDLAYQEGRYIGHMLASYNLNFGKGGRWREAVTEAVRSTREAFPGAGSGLAGGVAALVDKKAFRAADREELLRHLEGLGVEHKFKTSEC